MVPTETWCNDDQAAQNSSLQLPNYALIYQIRNNGQRGGGLAIYVHNSLDFKIPKKQSINSSDIECVCHLSVDLLEVTHINF